MARPNYNGTKDSTATIGFEAKLWLAADKLRNNMDAAEYNRAERDRSRASVTRRASRGLRVKYISDTFEEHRAKLRAGEGDYAGANPEDPDEPSGARQPAAGSPKGERGRAHQYFLTRFASAEGKNGGQFYTPSCVVRCLVEMLAPYTALRGSAFLQSEAKSQVVSEAKDNFRRDDEVRSMAPLQRATAQMLSTCSRNQR